MLYPPATSGCSWPRSTSAARTRPGAASASEVEGTWDALCRKAREHDGATVISHELLAAASAHQVTAAMTMLKGLDVHLVVTARDPARQATAEWQEGIKHGRRLTFEQFRRRVLDAGSETDYARRFRASQDLPGGARPVGRHAADRPRARGVLPAAGRRPGPAVAAVRRGGRRSTPTPLPGRRAGQREPLARADRDRPAAPGEPRARQAAGAAGVRPGRQAALRPAAARPRARRARPVVPREMYDDLAVVGERWVKEIDTGRVRRARGPGRPGPRARPRARRRTPTTSTRATWWSRPPRRPPSCSSRCSAAAPRWPGWRRGRRLRQRKRRKAAQAAAARGATAD